MSMSSTDRLYISTADFNAPYDGAQYLQGLGALAYDTKQGNFGPGGHGGGIFQTTVSGVGHVAPGPMSTQGRAGRGVSVFGPVNIPAAPGVSGLGKWPTGRSYWSTANFRAPYDEGYFQDNDLMGLGSIEDVKVVLRQIPTWAYLLAGAGASYAAWKGYKKGKKK